MNITTTTAQNLNEVIKLSGSVITAIGVVALLFLNSQYATKEEVEHLRNDQREMHTAIILLVEQNKINAIQDRRIDAIADRIREIEQKLAGMTISVRQ